jgi:hypothetical protein
MKTITIDGVEYNLTPIEKQSKQIILKQTLEFEVYPKDLGQHNWEDAKKVCKNLGNGWRLPTREELHLMWLNKDDSFAAAYHWSSSEGNNDNAWFQDFLFGNQTNYYKNSTNYVRPVRDIKSTEKGI